MAHALAEGGVWAFGGFAKPHPLNCGDAVKGDSQLPVLVRVSASQPSLATPFDFLWSLLSTDAQGSAGYNFTYYSNPTFDKLIYAASAEPDEAKRTALYTKAQRLAVDDAPYLFLSDVDYLLPVSPKLKGFEFNGMYVNSVDPYKLHV